MDWKKFRNISDEVIDKLSAQVMELEKKHRNTDDELETEDLNIKLANAVGQLNGARYLRDCLSTVYIDGLDGLEKKLEKRGN